MVMLNSFTVSVSRYWTINSVPDIVVGWKYSGGYMIQVSAHMELAISREEISK